MKIEELEVFENLSKSVSAPRKEKPPTLSRPTGVVKISHGKTVKYVVPYGVDYECDGGHFTELIEQAEFDRRFSLVKN